MDSSSLRIGRYQPICEYRIDLNLVLRRRLNLYDHFLIVGGTHSIDHDDECARYRCASSSLSVTFTAVCNSVEIHDPKQQETDNETTGAAVTVDGH